MSAMSSPDPVERAARLLTLVLERAPRTEQDLRAELDLVDPELAPLVDALERHGLLQRDDGRRRPAPPGLRRSATPAPRSPGASSWRPPPRACAGWPRRASRPSTSWSRPPAARSRS